MNARDVTLVVLVGIALLVGGMTVGLMAPTARADTSASSDVAGACSASMCCFGQATQAGPVVRCVDAQGRSTTYR